MNNSTTDKPRDEEKPNPGKFPLQWLTAASLPGSFPNKSAMRRAPVQKIKVKTDKYLGIYLTYENINLVKSGRVILEQLETGE